MIFSGVKMFSILYGKVVVSKSREELLGSRPKGYGDEQRTIHAPRG